MWNVKKWNEIKVKKSKHHLYTAVESSFSLGRREEKEDSNNQMLCVAALDDVKMHKLTNVKQQNILCAAIVRILCHNTTSILLSVWQQIQQRKASQADWSKEERTDSYLCCALFLA